MDGVSVASGIAGLITLALQVSGVVSEYVTAVKERPKNVKELHDELLLLAEVLSELRDFLNSEKIRGRSFDSNSVLQKAIRACHGRIERVGDKLKPADGGKLTRALERLKWPFEQKEVLQMVENLRRYTRTFQFAFNIEGCNVLCKTSDDAAKGLQQMLDMSRQISELSSQMGLSTKESSERAAQLEQILALIPMLTKTSADVDELSHAARLAELREQERRTTEILDWLAPISTLHKHREMQAKRAAGTCQWFLENPDFVRWVEGDLVEHDILCVGGPGAGKSVLCSFVIDHLRQRFKDQDVPVVHYYCDYSEQRAQTPLHFAGCILRQLCASCDDIPAPVAEFYQRTRNDIKDQTWFSDLQGILRWVMATFSRCFLVLDALDEADALSQRTGLFDVLQMSRTSPGVLRVFATSRPHLSNVENKLHRPIKVEVVADQRDLRQYLGQMIDDHPDARYILDPILRHQVLDKLCANAGGMFLLPALQIGTVLDQVTKADVKRTLNNLSTNLTEVFSSTMARISVLSSNRRNLAFQTLMWISHARRPLTVAELQHAMAIRFEEDDLDRDNFPSVRTVLDCCCGLVEVNQESGVIRLVHHSLEEYLRDHDHGLFQEGHLQIAKTCLKYMTLDSLKTMPFKNRADFAVALADLPFLEYACLEWGHHARLVPLDEIQDLALPLLHNSLSLLVVARVRDFHTPDFRKWRAKMWPWALSGGAGISIATSFGLTELVRLLISQSKSGLCINPRNMYGSTPLHEAAMYGYEDTAELLIAHGADLLDANYGKATPLYLAVSHGHFSVIQTLLKYGRAQLDCACGNGSTALHKAADLGSEPVVTILLQAGALVGAHDDRGMTPLHRAARRGYLPIARLLVLAGAVVHVKDNDHLCPLDYASTGGYTELVEFLLNNGGSIWHTGAEAWTPLHRAARGGHTETAAFLLERGADVLAEDFKGNLPIHLAVRSGNLDTVASLLQHDVETKGPQLSHRDRKGSTPRVVAFYTAHYDIHKYLRAAEWDFSGAEPSRANRLTTAIEKGALSEVQTYIEESKSYLELPDEDGQPPLHVAIQEGQMEIVKLLLDAGASVESVGYHGWHPLHIAASLGNLELVDLLLERGADIRARSSTRQTALHKAASSGSIAVVRRLIEAGADSVAVNDRGMGPLHVAAHQNDIHMVKLLVLDYHVDVLARDRFGQTAADWAARDSHFEAQAFLRVQARRIKSKLGPSSSVEDISKAFGESELD